MSDNSKVRLELYASKVSEELENILSTGAIDFVWVFQRIYSLSLPPYLFLRLLFS